MIIDEVRFKLLMNTMFKDKEKEDIFDEAIQKIYEFFEKPFNKNTLSEEIFEKIKDNNNINNSAQNKSRRVYDIDNLFKYNILNYIICDLAELPLEFREFIEPVLETIEDPHGNFWGELKLRVYDRESWANSKFKVLEVLKDPEFYNTFLDPEYEPWKKIEELESKVFPIRRKL